MLAESGALLRFEVKALQFMQFQPLSGIIADDVRQTGVRRSSERVSRQDVIAAVDCGKSITANFLIELRQSA